MYVKFRDEQDAAKAVQALTGRYYGGRPIQIEFSPVTDFREATCRQYEENTLTAAACNPASRHSWGCFQRPAAAHSFTLQSVQYQLHWSEAGARSSGGRALG